MSETRITRRAFLKSAAGAASAPALFHIIPRNALGRGLIPPSDKLNIAGIGVGGMGAANLRELESENIVALCDEEAARPPQTIPRIQGTHEQDWVRACKLGTRAGASFEYSGSLTEICLLGNVAKRLDGRIYWDAANLKVTNRPEAETLIRRPYREGWSL